MSTEEIVPPVVEPVEKSKSELVKEEREKLKQENEALEKEIKRSEDLRAKSIIAGRSQGASYTPPETADDKWKREAKERYKGTGMDPT